MVVTLLREYGAHAISRCVCLKEELFVEVWLGENRARAHVSFQFFEGTLL